MKNIIFALFTLSVLSSYGQGNTKPSLRSVLLEQLKTTHNQQDWFVPATKALEGLTPEQAMWKQGDANHSIAQLVSHLIFWDKQQLDKFNGKPAATTNNNDETFANVDKKTWPIAIKQLDDVLTEWENAVAGATDDKLESWYSTIAHIGAHNAYHTGQILYIRKQQGSWDANKGVK
jgi:uncharacterized damage-inducible protein DinB